MEVAGSRGFIVYRDQAFIRIPEIRKTPEFRLFKKYRYIYTHGTVQVFYTCTGILRRTLHRLIKVRQILLYKYINLYLVKTASLFTFHSLFYILYFKYHI